MGLAEVDLLSVVLSAGFALAAALLSSVLPQDWRQSVGGAAVLAAGLLDGVSVLDHKVVVAGFEVSNPLYDVAAVLS
jgi:hypothetical protein